jgi:uncharacterized protein (TIGR03382 family)
MTNQLRKARSLLLTVFVLITPHSAPAAIIGTSGAVAVVPAPLDLREGAWESDTEIRALAERQGVLLADALPVDITVPGQYGAGGTPNISPGAISAGTRIDSYLVHFDTIPDQSVSAGGSVTFDSAILGMLVRAQALIETDSLVGLPGALYPQGDARGWEFQQPEQGGGLDSLTFSADRQTISFELRNGARVDQIRILTAVPEPAAAVLPLMVAFAAWMQARRRPTTRRTRF